MNSRDHEVLLYATVRIAHHFGLREGGMATITALPTDAPRPRQGRRDRMREAWTTARRQATKTVSAVRHHNWSPALTVSGFAFIDLAAWETFGRGAGWLALGISILAFDWTRD